MDTTYLTADLSSTTQLERMCTAEQDALPFGLIQLARDGTVLSYNASESRLAQKDPATVIGRKLLY